MLLGKTTKQPLSNFEPGKPWKYKQLWDLTLVAYKKQCKFDYVYSKIWHIFVWSNKFDQILEILDITNLIKKNQLKLKSPSVKKKSANEWTWNIFSCKQQFTTSKFTACVYKLKIKSKIKCITWL